MEIASRNRADEHSRPEGSYWVRGMYIAGVEHGDRICAGETGTERKVERNRLVDEVSRRDENGRENRKTTSH